MAAIVDAVVAQDGDIDADATMEIWKGWTRLGPRGVITIDPETRDIIQDIRIFRVAADGDRLVMETLGVIPQVKDACKELKIGKCGE